MSKKKIESVIKPVKEKAPKQDDPNVRIDKVIAYLRKHSGDNNEIRSI